MKWFLRFLFMVFLSMVCMMGALGSKYPLSVFLIYLGKGMWILFFVLYFRAREKRIQMKKKFEDYIRWRNRNQNR